MGHGTKMESGIKKMGNECKEEVRQIIKELRGQAEGENLENNRLSGLFGGAAKHMAKQNAYEEAAEMLEERILQPGDSKE